jgi:hypothetical protein
MHLQMRFDFFCECAFVQGVAGNCAEAQDERS